MIAGHGEQFTVRLYAANDQPSADLLTQRMDLHQKTAWMRRVQLQD